MAFHYYGVRLKYATGEKIHPSNWDGENDRVVALYPRSKDINLLLDSIETEVQRIYDEAIDTKANLSKDYFRHHLKAIFRSESVVIKSFLECFDEFLTITTSTKKPNTVRKYISLLNHLKDFSKKSKISLSFETVDFKFYDLLIDYFINEKKHLDNTMGKYITALKMFLYWSADRGYNPSQIFKKFKCPSDKVDIITLTNDELMRLYNLDITFDTRLEQVRDFFCFGCFTGLRYSDIALLTKEKINGDSIRLKTKKTRDTVIIPLNVFSKAILEKHGYSIPAISNQKTNFYLKKIGMLAGLSERVIILKYSGVNEVTFDRPKYEFLTTHTARRTFITLSLEKGMRPETLMEITGIKSYPVFKRYIKITNKVKGVEMNKAWTETI